MKETGRRAPPFLAVVRGTAAARTRGLQQPPARVRSDSVGAAGPGRQPEKGGSGVAPGTQERGPPTVDALDSGLGLSGPKQPPAWENPGLLPGAAALPGRAGEGIPGICPETAARHWAESAHIWAALPLRQRGKPRPEPVDGAAPAHCTSRPRHPAPRSWEAGPGPRPGLSSPRDQGTRGGLDTRAGAAKCLGRAGEGTQIPERATNSSGVWAAQHSPPSARPASKKKTTEINKEPFFFT